jgi:hypothetical protein
MTDVNHTDASTDKADSATTSTEDANQTDRLVALALESAELFHDQNDAAFASVSRDGTRQTVQIGSRRSRQWLQREYRARHGRVPGQHAVAGALDALEAIAVLEGPCRATFVRVGQDGGDYYLDLGDSSWRSVAISAAGWRIDKASSVHFRRRATKGGLTEPINGGSINDLRPFVTVDDDDFKLMVGWLLMALHPHGPFPPLVLQGEQGSAKSTTAKMLKALIDPATPTLRSLPTAERDLAIAANGEWVLAFDNLSGMPTRMSDALCRLSTGGGVSARKLYTDDEERVFDLRRPLILNGLDAVITRQDLISRSVIIELPTLAPNERRDERELWEAFDAARPSILGALLDATSGALANAAETYVEGVPRMADFARHVTAAEEALGWTPGTFIDIYGANQTDALAVSLEGDSVATAIMLLLDKTDDERWVGTPTSLHDVLSQQVSLEQKQQRRWPPNAQVLSRRLKLLAPALRERGIHVERTSSGRGHDKERFFEIWRDGAGDAGDANGGGVA